MVQLTFVIFRFQQHGKGKIGTNSSSVFGDTELLINGNTYSDKIQIGSSGNALTPGKLEVYCAQGTNAGTYFQQRSGGAYTTKIDNFNLTGGSQANILELVGRQSNGVTKRLQVSLKTIGLNLAVMTFMWLMTLV